MSIESAKAFIERMKTDEAFKARVMAIADLDGRLKLAAAEGFDCTEEECRSVAREASDEDMDPGASGGFCFGHHEGPKWDCGMDGRCGAVC